MSIDDFWNEPDFFSSCAYGLPVFACRNAMKAWCGYVGVPAHSPLFNLSYGDDVLIDPSKVPIGGQSPITLLTVAFAEEKKVQSLPLDAVIDCPGGLTYARGPHWKSPDGYWWFGFDCSHYNDLTPKGFFDNRREHFNLGGTYRTFPFVKSALYCLASQLSDFHSSFPEHWQ